MRTDQEGPRFKEGDKVKVVRICSAVFQGSDGDDLSDAGATALESHIGDIVTIKNVDHDENFTAYETIEGTDNFYEQELDWP